LCAIASPAQAATIDADANGNAVTGGMSFTPAEIDAEVGDEVVWTNTDFLAPHTSTEDHDLWNVGGNYAGPPLTVVPGYGPGESAGRPFEAGTHSYYCVVHGAEAMSGIVAVPVTLKAKKGKGSRPGKVQVRWAPGPPAEGITFDVQIRQSGSSRWLKLEKGTTKPRGSFDPGADGGTWRVRARMRGTEPGAMTGWSPVAKVGIAR
jgi:plastocyanin